ncbi:GNAT family N-acetyltransferase [Streptomyces sp. NBC_01456]|uniref:GNAT family N-acetyltransferase n=1 Tax=unclassified Streptomyces TaxID=2593676 RepID=UPI002E2F7D17|nr:MULTISPECIES: GNAT family N-acetyltransferase [unclassified Streptomyces]
MAWTTTQDPEDFEAAAGAFLRSRPTAHTVLLSVVSSLRSLGADVYGADAPAFGWWRPSGQAPVGAAFVWTPPRTVLLSPMPDEAAGALVETLAAERTEIPGVKGGRAVAEAVAGAWQRRHGGTVICAQRLRLHRLDQLIEPSPAPPGAARRATTADRDLLLAWFTAFAAEIGGTPPRDARAADDRIAGGRCLLWETGGRPVSMACHTDPLAGAARVAPVYTPPELRGRGYAGAVTAAVSRAVRARGTQEVLLFTDLANPTSNALYRRLGYRPVEDQLALEFGRE